MKNFILGVLATALAGLIVYFGQSIIDDATGDKTHIEYYTYNPPFYLDQVKTNNWFSKIPSSEFDEFSKDGRIKIQAMVIENKGEKAIENQRVVIGPDKKDKFSSGIIDFQNDIVPGANGLDTKMSISDGTLVIDYDLLNVGEIHRFWIVSDRFTDKSVNIRKPGLTTKGWNAKIYTQETPEDWGFETAMAVAIGLLIALFLGFYIQYKETKKILILQDIDYDDIVEKYQKTLKEKKKEKERLKYES